MESDIYAKPDMTKKVRKRDGDTESDIYAEPDMTKKVRNGDGDRGQRVDWEERVVDIYQSVDDCVPGPQEDMRDNTAGRQAQVTANLVAVSGQRSKTERRPLGVVAAGCLGTLCLRRTLGVVAAVCLGILLGVIIGLGVSYTLARDHNTLKSNNTKLTQEKDQLQSEVNQLKTQIAESCPTDWKKFGCSCYYRTTQRKTWEDGRYYCESQGADLVIINSGEEQVFIDGLRRVDGYYSWVGLTRTKPEGRWTWVDGTALTPQYWESGYPNDHGDCAAYDHRTNRGTLYNEPCSYETYSICEK